MDKKNGSFLARFRGWFQAGAALLTNIHLPNFAKGVLYQGKGKTVCVPGLNCYSCPGAAGACPQGVLEGAIPLSLTNAGIRAALGKLFSWKLCILLAVVVASVVFYRPFCKWLCPLGAFYAVMNRVSLFQMRVDTDKCVSCGACARACKMDVDITKTPNHAECIRCGMCIKSCPTKAIHYQYGFGDKADNSKEI